MESLKVNETSLCTWPAHPTVEYIDGFMSTREKYRSTDDPLRTLQVAFMDEAAEIGDELHKKEFDAADFAGEIGDAVIMGVLIARHQGADLAEVIGHPTLNELQQGLAADETYTFQTFGVVVMDVYDSIGRADPDMNALKTYFEQLAGLTKAEDIALDDCVRIVVEKLLTRKRGNHAVDDAGDDAKPTTHAGKYLVKKGIFSAGEMVELEKSPLG